MIGIESVVIVVGIIKVIGNLVKKTCSLKIDKHEKIEMFGSTILNTITDLVPKRLRMTSSQAKSTRKSHWSLRCSH